MPIESACNFLLVNNSNYLLPFTRYYDTIRYDTIEEFNVDWKAE